MSANTLFEIALRVDVPILTERFKRDRRVQVRDFLTSSAATTVRNVLEHDTPWGVAIGGIGRDAVSFRAEKLRLMAGPERARLGESAYVSARKGEFSFVYNQYPMVQAYLERWDPGHAMELLLEHINDPATLDLVRAITGMQDIVKADAQATLFGPGHFLSSHDDSMAEAGRRAAYVLNFAREWRPEWGGYLLFLDPDGDVSSGFRPRFNTLNLFAVPQRHIVSYVPPYAPFERFAITGWFRDC